MAYIPRLKQEYKDKVVSALIEEFGYDNVMQVPKLQKIVISKGVGVSFANLEICWHTPYKKETWQVIVRMRWKKRLKPSLISLSMAIGYLLIQEPLK